jgi:hypothetical protein
MTKRTFQTADETAWGEFKRALKSTDEIELIVTGRVSGRKTSRPVWFVAEGDSLYFLPVRGSDTQWFKTVLHNPTITLAVNGVTWTVEARPILDPVKVREIIEKFRAKYGATNIRKYYSKLDVAVEVPLA